jgi:hypothetical protein
MLCGDNKVLLCAGKSMHWRLRDYDSVFTLATRLAHGMLDILFGQGRHLPY